MPVMPVCSLREPTWYQTPKLDHRRAVDFLRQDAEPVGQARLGDPRRQGRVRRRGRRLAPDEHHAGERQDGTGEDPAGAASCRPSHPIH